MTEYPAGIIFAGLYSIAADDSRVASCCKHKGLDASPHVLYSSGTHNMGLFAILQVRFELV